MILWHQTCQKGDKMTAYERAKTTHLTGEELADLLGVHGNTVTRLAVSQVLTKTGQKYPLGASVRAYCAWAKGAREKPAGKQEKERLDCDLRRQQIAAYQIKNERIMDERKREWWNELKESLTQQTLALREALRRGQPVDEILDALNVKLLAEIPAPVTTPEIDPQEDAERADNVAP